MLKAAEVGLATEDVSMPLADTVTRVDAATKLIDEGKYYEANLELKKVEDGLVRESVVLLRPSAPAPQPKPAEGKAGK